MGEDYVWQEVINGRQCAIKKVVMNKFSWYCGYVEVKRDDGQIYKFANKEDYQKADTLLRMVSFDFPELTFAGTLFYFDDDFSSEYKLFLGFDTENPFVKTTQEEVAQQVKKLVDVLESDKNAQQKRN